MSHIEYTPFDGEIILSLTTSLARLGVLDFGFQPYRLTGPYGGYAIIRYSLEFLDA